jgi:hypothetical protein
MPRVKLTRWTRLALTFLEFYLVLLFILILVRFFSGHH